jgi:hypothetical protein
LAPASDIRLKTRHQVENIETANRGGFFASALAAGSARLNRTLNPRFAVRDIAIKNKKENALNPAIIAFKKTKRKKKKEKMDQVKNGPSDVECRSRGRERRDDD